MRGTFKPHKPSRYFACIHLCRRAPYSHSPISTVALTVYHHLLAVLAHCVLPPPSSRNCSIRNLHINMPTYDEPVGDVDIIFAGGGIAACVAAGRLAKANPDLKILLVEGGRNNFNDPTDVNTAVYLSHLPPDSTTTIVSS